MLLDPADEEYLATPGANQLQEGIRLGETILEQHATGELPDTIRDTFRSFAERLSDDGRVQDLILDAHIGCYTKETQARMERPDAPSRSRLPLSFAK